MKRLVSDGAGGVRVITSTRDPKETWYVVPPKITNDNVSIVDIIDGSPVINATRETIYNAAKATEVADMASAVTKQTERQVRLATGHKNFATLNPVQKDALLKDLLEDKLGL